MTKASKQSKQDGWWILLMSSLLLLLVIWISIMFGSVNLQASLIFSVLKAKILGLATIVPLAQQDIIWELRLPRVLLAAVVGAGLALSGTVMQSAVQNPLAEPFILGIASGASVGAVTGILLEDLFLPSQGIAVCAFIGAIVATAIVLLLGGLGHTISTVKLILAGAVVSALGTAIANFIVYMAADTPGIQNAIFWMMGSLADAKWDNLFLPVLAVMTLLIYFMSQIRNLDALLMGDEVAITLGINTKRKRQLYMGLIALLTGVLVAQCGIIGFVGLVVPHAIRTMVGASHRLLLPVSVLSGAIFLVLADLLSRIVLPSGDLPIGILTALIGAPLFMKLLFGNSRNFGG